MAGQSLSELAGTIAMPTLTTAPTAMSGGGAVTANGEPQPHVSVVVLVLLAVGVLLLLDKAGFRFAVTVGRS